MSSWGSEHHLFGMRNGTLCEPSNIPTSLGLLALEDLGVSLHVHVHAAGVEQTCAS